LKGNDKYNGDQNQVKSASNIKKIYFLVVADANKGKRSQGLEFKGL
jgi:hypothetical protein